MTIRELTLRDFRCYERAEATIGEGTTVVVGPNGAGKTNLLEALYFGCTGRSCRTNNEREVVRFGAPATRVVVSATDEGGDHELAVGFAPGEAKRMQADGARVERMLDAPHRPLLSVFMPDRLELIKGPPGLRRAHLDQFIAALWPARAATRRGYAQALAQRNALLSRVREGRSSPASLSSWDVQLARHGIELMADRRRAIEALSDAFTACGAELGFDHAPLIAYRPRSGATDEASLAQELSSRIDADLQRGFTGHGPHRDELSIRCAGRELRTYGSQGQQRLGLLALLLAERETIATTRGVAPVVLLDDVMSELDAERRRALTSLLHSRPGQAILTTTDLEHVPDAGIEDAACIMVEAGQISQPAPV